MKFGIHQKQLCIITIPHRIFALDTRTKTSTSGSSVGLLTNALRS